MGAETATADGGSSEARVHAGSRLAQIVVMVLWVRGLDQASVCSSY